MKYALVIDESITIGSQKLLLVLAIPSEHKRHALTHKDVKVVGMFVSKSWKTEEVSKKLQAIMDAITYGPEYVLSDNGHNLVKATAELNLPHHKDIGHTFGIILKDAYGEDSEFKEFTTEMGKARLRFHLTSNAYLLPPNQRSIARFMNCFDWVEWGNRMIENFPKLTEEQQLAFAFVPKHRELLEELSCVMECYKHVMEKVKNDGLSRKLHKELCLYMAKMLASQKSNRVRRIVLRVWDYLKEEVEKLRPYERAHNLSSDIIESTFGVFKERKSPNKLYGVTSFVLFIPAHAGVTAMRTAEPIDFKRIFSEYHLKDTADWKKENLLTNWVVERTNTLKKVG